MPKKQCNSSGEEFSREVIAALKAAGVGAKQADDFNFYLYLDTKKRALACAEPLRKSGFAVEVRRAASGPQWLCLASMKLLPTARRLTVIGSQFLELAKQHDGDFDGWEIQPKPMNIDEGLLKRFMEQFGIKKNEKRDDTAA